MRDLTSIFPYVADEFLKEGISHVLIGGFAVNFYNVTRQTEDVDFMIAVGDFQKARKVMEKGGYVLTESRDAFARFSKPENAGLDLDLLFVDPDTFKKVIADAKSVKIAQREFRIPSLHHLIGLKLHAIRNNPKNRELKDLPDIVRLIANNNMDHKSEAFRDFCLKYGTEDTFKKIKNYLE